MTARECEAKCERCGNRWFVVLHDVDPSEITVRCPRCGGVGGAVELPPVASPGGTERTLADALAAAIDAWAEESGNSLFGNDQGLIDAVTALVEPVDAELRRLREGLDIAWKWMGVTVGFHNGSNYMTALEQVAALKGAVGGR